MRPSARGRMYLGGYNRTIAIRYSQWIGVEYKRDNRLIALYKRDNRHGDLVGLPPQGLISKVREYLVSIKNAFNSRQREGREKEQINMKKQDLLVYKFIAIGDHRTTSHMGARHVGGGRRD